MTSHDVAQSGKFSLGYFSARRNACGNTSASNQTTYTCSTV